MLAQARALAQPGDARRRRAVLASSGVTHFLHDGFSDVLFLLLPLWQAEFGLSLAATGVLKSCYSGALAAFQVPAGLLAERFGERAPLALGTVVTALGFIVLGYAGGFLALALTLIVAGAGSGTQHPLNATMVAAAYAQGGRRAALGIYNFTGDLGKVAVPLAAALVIAASDWRFAASVYGAIGVLVAGGAFVAMRALAVGDPPGAAPRPRGIASGRGWGITDRRGFGALAAIGIVDSAVRTGFLTFLPFLLRAKGAEVAAIGLALGLTFAGGAAGKFLCGVLAERAGILRTVVLTELATALGILVVVPVPLLAALAILPLVGVALNGTSSVLYASVAEFVAAERRARGFGLFYTLGIGASAAAPFLFGVISDATDVTTALLTVALLVTATLPLTFLLRRPLAAAARR
jgi:MFS family permease